MRRLAAFAVLLAVLTLNSVSLADSFTDPAWYTGDTRDKVKVNADNYSTVLIYDARDSSQIVYIGQADSVFNSAADFLLKNNPACGRYTVKLGKKNGDYTETYFYVGADSNTSDDLYLKRLQGEEQNLDDSTWNIGYYAMMLASAFNNYTALKVGYNDGGILKYGSITLDEDWDTIYSGPGDLCLIFQLNNVPAAYKDSAAVYLVPSSSGGGE